jgi:Phage integrase family
MVYLLSTRRPGGVSPQPGTVTRLTEWVKPIAAARAARFGALGSASGWHPDPDDPSRNRADLDGWPSGRCAGGHVEIAGSHAWGGRVTCEPRNRDRRRSSRAGDRFAREAFVALDELSRREWFTSPDDFVFCGPAGDPIEESALRRRFNAARDAAGLPRLPFHHLRHTFATLAIRGLDPATVQVLMGHSKITTTERYLHARPLTELAERMDAIFGTIAAPLEQADGSRS